MKTIIHLKTTSFILVIALIIIPWIVLSFIVLNPKLMIWYTVSPTPVESPKTDTITGSWGKLEVSPIVIQPPGTFFREYHSLIDSSKKWFFENMDLEEIRRLFVNAGISQKVSDELIKHTEPITEQNYTGYVTTPPDAILRNFTPDIRAKLYPIIGSNEKNSFYNHPYRFDSLSVNDWFLNSRIKKTILKKILPLAYRRNNFWCISDIHLIESMLTSQDENINLFQNLFRSKGLRVNLVIDPEDDIEEIIKYWGNMGREQFISSILTCSQKSNQKETIDIINLLPPLPRNRLNTFISKEEYNQYLRDCHWLMFNFFNTKSDERFNDENNRNSLFYIISKPLPQGSRPKFGDIVLLKNSAGQFIHSCVYIADNIVFTKNGKSFDSPFVLSYLGDVKRLYDLNGAVEIVYYSRLIGDTITSIVPKNQ